MGLVVCELCALKDRVRRKKTRIAARVRSENSQRFTAGGKGTSKRTPSRALKTASAYIDFWKCGLINGGRSRSVTTTHARYKIKATLVGEDAAKPTDPSKPASTANEKGRAITSKAPEGSFRLSADTRCLSFNANISPRT